MEQPTPMDRSIEAVMHDLQHALVRVKELRAEAEMLAAVRNNEGRLPRVREIVADLQARLEGILVFVEACRTKAHGAEASAEEIDLWM